jgi:hypothetical protein
MTSGSLLRRVGLATVLMAAPSARALAQTLGQGPAAGFPWLRWFLALAFCLVLAVAGALALRMRAQGRGAALSLPRRWTALLGHGAAIPRRLALVEVLRVSPALEVCLLRCDEQDYLVAATPQGAVQLSPAPRRHPAERE